jgi:hypothetical protein
MNGSNLGMVKTFDIDLGTTGGLWVFGVTAAVPFIVGGIMFVVPLILHSLQLTIKVHRSSPILSRSTT